MEVKVKKVLSLHVTKAGNAAEVSDSFACMHAFSSCAREGIVCIHVPSETNLKTHN